MKIGLGLLVAIAALVTVPALQGADQPIQPKGFFHRGPDGCSNHPYGPEEYHPSLCRRCCDKLCGWWHRLEDRCDRCSCGYGKTNHDFGCVGHRAEKTFIFGSCWEFFEEPCNKQPQPPCLLLEKLRGRQ